MLGTTVIYALVVLLATFLDELWHSMVSMTVVFLMVGIEATTGANGIFSYIVGRTDSLAAAGTCVMFTIVLLAGAVCVIQRREF